MKLLTILLSLTALAISASHMARGEQVNITHSGVPALGLGASPTIDSQSMGSLTSGRAVVVIEGGGAPHPFTTPFAACKEGRDTYIQRMIDAGLPVFTAPGFTNLNKSSGIEVLASSGKFRQVQARKGPGCGGCWRLWPTW